MKKWLKKNGKWIVICFGILAFSNSIWGITRSLEPGREFWLAVHMVGATVWAIIILLYSGIVKKFYDWWEKE